MTENNFNKIFELDKFMNESENFKNNKPFKFAYIENIFKPDFYQKLHDGYPDEENEMLQSTQFSKNSLYRDFANMFDITENENAKSAEDPKLNQQWNKLYQYLSSDEFITKIREFSGVPVNKLKSFRFGLMKKGGFQMPHAHNDGPSTIIVFFFFSKGWQKGDPGGTYLASEPEESKIFLEPYNLDNTMVMLHDGPDSVHGVRYITKDITRKCLQIYFEEYSEKDGWSGKGHDKPMVGKIEL